MKTFIKQIDWLPQPHGFGNGYVIVEKGHVLHGKSEDEINVDVHGGLTLACSINKMKWRHNFPEMPDAWVFGFDTAHSGDNMSNCPASYVYSETESLKNQLIVIANSL